ncbi:unnamed protein product [Calicophoron daubneyi]|uniref:L-type lectin-like domain-containing protein n=1 Tax=Calicophoron daubneyi TaxID=300641 RepID=A0AAV2T882_CALDB
MRTLSYLIVFIWTNIQLQSSCAYGLDYKLHPEHSLLHPVPNNPDLWILNDDARCVDGTLELVPDKSWKVGIAWNGIPVDYCHWQVDIQFEIKAGGIPADGFAFFYTREPITKGEPNSNAGALGGPNNFYGLGVFVDTYDNKGEGYFPKVYPVLLNGKFVYVHYKNGHDQRPYNCPFYCINKKVRIQVIYWDEILHMTTIDEWGRETCHKRSWHVKLPAGGYFSITAVNGLHSERVRIHEFKVNEVISPEKCFHRDGKEPSWREDTY